MADNVAISAGVGTDVATDQTGGSSGPHYQKIKLADGAPDSTSMIGGDSTFGLDVDLTRLPPNSSASGTLGALDAVVNLDPANGETTMAIQLVGSFSGTVTPEVSLDGGTTWVSRVPFRVSTREMVAAFMQFQGVWLVAVPSMAKFRVRMSAYTSGSTTAYLVACRGANGAYIEGPLPTGTNTIGSVTAQGTGAHNTPASSNPVAIGGTAYSGIPSIAVDDQDNVRTWHRTRGQMVVNLVLEDGTEFGLKDNAAFTDGTSPVIPVGFVFDETAGTALTENDVAAGRINLNRAIVGVIEDGATRGRYAVVVSGGDLCTQAQGDVAHDSADAGRPVKVGGRAQATAPTDVADGDRVNAWFLRSGAIVSDVFDRAARLVGQVEGRAAADAAVAGNPNLVGGRASEVVPTAVSADGDAVPAWLDRSGALMVRHREFVTYSAVYRLATTSAISSLTFAFSANADKQLATIYHSGSAAKLVKLRLVEVYVADVGTASVINFELRALSSTTAPATGNPAITPRILVPGAAAAEATCLALPGTAGSEAASNSPLHAVEFESGILAGATSANQTKMDPIVLWDDQGHRHMECPAMRAGNAEGYAVIGRQVTAGSTRFKIRIIFTEETP